jgi:hypothetical protein
MLVAFDPSTPPPKVGAAFPAIRPGPDRFPLGALLERYAKSVMQHKQIATDARSETI